jgi:uncharacterized protein (DUF2141 family)
MSVQLAATQTNQPPQAADSRQSAAQVSGRVLRADTGYPVSKAEVSLYPQDEKTSQTLGGNRTVRTTPDGLFLFDDLPPGNYAVSVQHNGDNRFTGKTDLRVQSHYFGELTLTGPSTHPQ